MNRSVVFCSFLGSFSDSPKALYDELLSREYDLDYIWLVRPEVIVDGPARKVDIGSDEGFAAIAEADFVIANCYMDDFATKPEAVFVQTWHGTPLKRVGYDNPNFSAERAVTLPLEVNRWNYFVSPNPFSSDKLVNAFEFDKELLETGYPRNDVLQSAAATEIRSTARAKLGINDDDTVILYAPTYRDATAGTPSDNTVHLELQRVQASLGPKVVFLLRMHYYVHLPNASLAQPSVRDVSGYTDINELYLATDVLLTDYSSSMFDFAITHKPMAFFTYDFDQYRSSTRGFYFDFEVEAPGPLLATNDEVIAALSNLDDMVSTYANRYTDFRAKYTSWEDGGASARVVDAVFGPRP